MKWKRKAVKAKNKWASTATLPEIEYEPDKPKFLESRNIKDTWHRLRV